MLFPSSDSSGLGLILYLSLICVHGDVCLRWINNEKSKNKQQQQQVCLIDADVHKAENNKGRVSVTFLCCLLSVWWEEEEGEGVYVEGGLLPTERDRKKA